MEGIVNDNNAGSDVIPGHGEPSVMFLADGSGSMRLSESHLDVVAQLPLPGIVIFVHGVNSDGEWFQAAEEGLCKGLNARLKRNKGQIVHDTVAGGHLTPVPYLPDLTPDGYLNPEKTEKKFIESGEHFSPVLHFRWGYKASSADMQVYGKNIFLNEEKYWGGGPFANGCTSLPDLWGSGLNDQLFLWLHAQHMNPTNDRLVYACPPRPYYVLAALRLAKLIQSIREKQADVPVTIVCHSQGNMVSLAAAFLGERLGSVTDAEGKTGRCVADAYVLCNPPYSLLEKNLTEGWTEREMKDAEGKTGRQTLEARVGTLSNFFKIMREQASNAQAPALIDALMKNEEHKFDAETDRKAFGYGPSHTNHGLVTLYFNPHDQVISATTIQGIGWRGMSAEEIRSTGGTGVFCQRVFAQGFEVGNALKKNYHFWNDHYLKAKGGGKAEFWHPPSPPAKYSMKKGLDANEHWYAKIGTVVSAPLFYLVTSVFSIRINGVPDPEWKTPLEAPGLVAFQPRSIIFGQDVAFDQGTEAQGESRDKLRVRDDSDPYKVDRILSEKKGKSGIMATTDAARGNVDSEAALRYEHHALLRMRAKREGLYKNSEARQGEYRSEDTVSEEDDLGTASEGYKKWRAKKIKDSLAENTKVPATDHSSIMTNPDHSEKALAYDIPIGVCHIRENDLSVFRTIADWRYLAALKDDNPCSQFGEYFDSGLFKEMEISKWAEEKAGEGRMPSTIIDKRTRFGS